MLPSYREGTPRTVLEAMAMGRPIITTDAPGCRETVRFQTKDHADQTTNFTSPQNNSPNLHHSRLLPLSQPILPPSAHSASSAVNPSHKPTNPQTHKLSIGANGILIPPRDAEALAEAMRFFLQNPEQIAIMGGESRKYAEDRYDVHKVNAVMLQELGLTAR